MDAEPTPTPNHGLLFVSTWRGRRYPVAEVLGSWRLQDRCWDRERCSDHTYFRVQTPDFQVFELYFDHVPACGYWMWCRIEQNVALYELSAFDRHTAWQSNGLASIAKQ